MRLFIIKNFFDALKIFKGPLFIIFTLFDLLWKNHIQYCENFA